MRDSSGVCEIEEESYYSEYSPEVDSYCSEYSPQVDNSNGKVSWILNKGWGIGKKLMVTGAVISSAPFVLPPLVVTSAIAFACWVPSGVVLASYACSEKIMSKLLPYNSTTGAVSMLNDEDEEEFEDTDEGVKVDVGQYLDVEEEPMLDAIDGGRYEVSRYEYNDDFLLDESAISDGVDALVFNVNEDQDQDEDEDEYGVPQIEVTSVVLEQSEGEEKENDFLGEEELVKETTGLLEKITAEGNTDHGMEMDNQYVDGTAGSRRDSMDILLDNNVVSDGVDVFVSYVIEGEGEGEGEGEILIEESEEKEIVNDFGEDEEVVEETGRLLDEIRYAGSANNAVAMAESYAQGEEEMDEIIRSNFKETKSAVDTDGYVSLDRPTHPMEAGLPKESEKTEGKKHVFDANAVSEDQRSVLKSENSDNIVRAEKPIGEISIVHNVLEAERSISDKRVDLRIVSTVVEETHTPAMNKDAIQAERAENNITQVKLQLIRKKENVVSTNADAREIADESGLYVFDEKNASGRQDAHTLDYRTPTYEGLVDGEGGEYAELPISSRVESTDAKISSRTDDIHSNGVLNEDKIRKQIDAIRSIVGYKDKPQASYTEELKALYIFTGVEPPTSSDDPPDLAQVDNKLRFLKAIIGLK